jgi:hypothetical protein
MSVFSFIKSLKLVLCPVFKSLYDMEERIGYEVNPGFQSCVIWDMLPNLSELGFFPSIK